jgi:cytochrome c biogenesis protein CcmG, thiol:disulfide interchange protein DsbE
VTARTFAVFIAVLAVIALLAFGLIEKSNDALAVGEPIPDADLPRLTGDGSGSIADYRGQWVLVNVWASWCVPCRDETPTLQRFHARHRADNFTVVGINIRDVSSDAQDFVEQYDVTYPQLRDPEDTRFDALGMTGVPESFLVDPDGNLALIRPGPVTEDYLNETAEPRIERTA